MLWYGIYCAMIHFFFVVVFVLEATVDSIFVPAAFAKLESITAAKSLPSCIAPASHCTKHLSVHGI